MKTVYNILLYGEFGIFPIERDIQTRMISFWTKLIAENNPKISSSLFHFMYHEFDINNTIWLKTVKKNNQMRLK